MSLREKFVGRIFLEDVTPFLGKRFSFSTQVSSSVYKLIFGSRCILYRLILEFYLFVYREFLYSGGRYSKRGGSKSRVDTQT